MTDLRDPECNFCGKPQSQVHNLMKSDRRNLSICDECVMLCLHLMEESDPEWLAAELKGFPRFRGKSN